MIIELIKSGRDCDRGVTLKANLIGDNNFTFRGPAGQPPIYIILENGNFIDYCKTEKEARGLVVKHTEEYANSINQRYWNGADQLLCATDLGRFLNQSQA